MGAAHTFPAAATEGTARRDAVGAAGDGRTARSDAGLLAGAAAKQRLEFFARRAGLLRPVPGQRGVLEGEIVAQHRPPRLFLPFPVRLARGQRGPDGLPLLDVVRGFGVAYKIDHLLDGAVAIIALGGISRLGRLGRREGGRRWRWRWLHGICVGVSIRLDLDRRWKLLLGRGLDLRCAHHNNITPRNGLCLW